MKWWGFCRKTCDFHSSSVNWNKHSMSANRRNSMLHMNIFHSRVCFPIIFYERHWRKLSTSYSVFSAFCESTSYLHSLLFNERAHFRILHEQEGFSVLWIIVALQESRDATRHNDVDVVPCLLWKFRKDFINEMMRWIGIEEMLRQRSGNSCLFCLISIGAILSTRIFKYIPPWKCRYSLL